MKNKRRKFGAEFKAKVALEALREHQTLKDLCSKYQLHPNQISDWKKHVLQNTKDLFTDSLKRGSDEKEKLTEELYKQIGQLKVELDWVKKKSGLN